MIADILSITGPWIWVIFGLILLGFEILLPSTFLLWPGLAALLVGAITLLLGLDNPVWPWQAQILVFLALSLIIAWMGRKYLKDRKLDTSDQPYLNERGAQLIGQTATLSAAIENGQGRARIGDTTWTVKGADAAEGSKVRVVAVDGSILNVELV